MLKMLKGFVMSPKKDNEVEEVHYNEDEKENVKKKELSFRPQEGSLTAYWVMKNKNILF